MSDPEENDPDLVAARRFLERLIRGLGLKLQDVDAKLGFQRGWVSRVIHGNIRISYLHLLQILRVLGVEPHLFFSALHPPPRQFRPPPVPGDLYEDARALAERVLSRLPAAPAAEPPAPVSKEDLEVRINRAILAVLQEREASPPPGGKK